MEVNRTTWSVLGVTLANAKIWTEPSTFRINYPGFRELQFLLFRDGIFSSRYRELHLFVRVS